MDIVRSHFYAPTLQSVDAVTVAPTGDRLIVARSGGELLFLTTAPSWQVVQRVPGDKARSVRAFAWLQDDATQKWRLFGCGLDGVVVEWDYLTGVEVESAATCGGAAWDMVALNGSLVAACDDGSLHLLDPAKGLAHQRCLRGTTGRVLSVAVVDGNLFAGGSDSTISRWKPSSWQCDERMTAEKSGGAETLIWTLTACGNGLLASGDSLGLVCVWDALSCTLLQRHATHQADVLKLHYVPSTEVLVSASVDTKVAFFTKLPKDAGFAFEGFRGAHSHDVRALAHCAVTGTIVSGGADQIAVHPAVKGELPRKALPLSPVTPAESIAVASGRKESPLVLCRHPSHVDIWYLEKGAKPVKMWELKLKGSGHLTASTISPDGQYVALSNADGTRVFQLSLADMECRKVETKSLDRITAAAALHFLDAHRLVVCPANGTSPLRVHDLEGEQSKETKVAEAKPFKAPVTHIASEGDVIVASDSTGLTQLIDLSADEVSHVPFSSPLTSLALSRGRVFAVFADSAELGIFDAQSKSLQKFKLPIGSLVDAKDRIFGIEAVAENKVLLWGPTLVLTADLTLLSESGNDAEETRPRKKRRFGGGDGEGVITPAGWKVNRGLKMLFGLHRCADGEFLSAEQTAQELRNLLPAPFQRKRHG